MWHMSASSAVGTEIAAKQQSAPSRRLQFMFVSKTPKLSSGAEGGNLEEEGLE